MRSPWEPAIAQTLQRHGGSHRSVPKSVKSIVPAREPEKAQPEAAPKQAGETLASSKNSDRSAA